MLPVTVLGAQRPTRSKLPEELAALDDAEWYSLGEDKLWESSLRAVVDAIVTEVDSSSKLPPSGGRWRLPLVLGAVALVVVLAAVVFLLVRSAPSMPPLGASAAVTRANPDRLTSELLSSQMSSGTLPIGTSPQSPQLDSFNSYSIQGLNAQVFVPLTGPAETMHLSYLVFGNEGDASSYYSVSSPVLSGQKVIDRYQLPNVSDMAKCVYGRSASGGTQGPTWDSSCLVQSDYVVSFIYVAQDTPSSTTMNQLTTSLVDDALRHLENVAGSSGPDVLTPPPGSLNPDALFAQLQSSFDVPWAPPDYSSPTVSSKSQTNATGFTMGEYIEVDFVGPDHSDYFRYFVFDDSQRRGEFVRRSPGADLDEDDTIQPGRIFAAVVLR